MMMEMRRMILTAQANDAGEVRVGAVGPSDAAGVTFGVARDTNLYRSAANVLKTDGGLNINGQTVLYSTGSMDMTERTDPAAPAANTARLYSRDNGSGKTQLVVRFPSGAVQVIATEP